MAYEKPFRGKALSISATDVGRWQDVSKASQREKLAGTFDPTNMEARPTLWVHGKNTAATDFDRFAIVQIGGPSFLYQTETQRTEFLEGRTCNAHTLTDYTYGSPGASSFHNFGITMEPIKVGKFGKIAIAGTMPCKVFLDSPAPSQYRFAAPLLSDSTRMLGVTRGPCKLWGGGETLNRGADDYWQYVNLTRSETWYGAAHGVRGHSISSTSLQYLGFSGNYVVHNQCYTGGATAGSHTGICARYKVPVLIDYTIMVRPAATVSSPGWDVTAKLQTVHSSGVLQTLIKEDTFGFRSATGDTEFTRYVATYTAYEFLDPAGAYVISVTTQSTSSATYVVDMSLKVTELH